VTVLASGECENESVTRALNLPPSSSKSHAGILDGARSRDHISSFSLSFSLWLLLQCFNNLSIPARRNAGSASSLIFRFAKNKSLPGKRAFPVSGRFCGSRISAKEFVALLAMSTIEHGKYLDNKAQLAMMSLFRFFVNNFLRYRRDCRKVAKHSESHDAIETQR